MGLHPAGRLPVQGREEAAGGQQDGALREAAAPLAHPLQVPLGEVGHADGPCRAVQELVAVPGREHVLFSPCAVQLKGEKCVFSF